MGAQNRIRQASHSEFSVVLSKTSVNTDYDFLDSPKSYPTFRSSFLCRQLAVNDNSNTQSSDYSSPNSIAKILFLASKSSLLAGTWCFRIYFFPIVFFFFFFEKKALHFLKQNFESLLSLYKDLTKFFFSPFVGALYFIC